MALRIDNPEADRLARALAAQAGETVEQSVLIALRERLARVEERPALRPDPLPDPGRAVAEALAIARRVKRLPVLDPRTDDEILGYDEHGLPHRW